MHLRLREHNLAKFILLLSYHYFVKCVCALLHYTIVCKGIQIVQMIP